MGAGHAHTEVPPEAVGLRRWSRIGVVGLIIAISAVALLGVVHWWPDGQRVDRVRGLIPFAAPGYEVVHADLVKVVPVCTRAGAGARCGHSSARVLEGASKGMTVSVDLSPDVVGTGLRAGDGVLLFDGTAAGGRRSDVAGVDSSPFTFYRADRGAPMVWLAILFVLVVLLVAWRRGVMALISLGFAALVVIGFLLPALISGMPPVPVTMSASVLILVVILYATHGFSMRTSVALVGALVGVALSALYAWLAVDSTRLAGLGEDAAALLTYNVAWVRVQQLVIASVILAGLGTLNDVTVTQASALWELRAAAPAMTRWDLFRSAMRIGRDHVASTVYTLVFAYLGTSLVLLLAVQLYGGGPVDFLTAEDVAEEVVRTLVGGIALMLAMPITTAIGALVLDGATVEQPTSPPARRDVQTARPSPDRYRRLPDDPWHAE